MEPPRFPSPIAPPHKSRRCVGVIVPIPTFPFARINITLPAALSNCAILSQDADDAEINRPTFVPPRTSSGVVGVAVPIPTLPPFLIINRVLSVLPPR